MSSLLHQHRIKIRSLTRTGGGQNFMVWWCAFWTPGCYWIPCGRERISDKHSHAVRKCTVHAVDKSIVCHWASWIAGFEKGQTEFSDKHPSGQPTPVTMVLLPSVDKLTTTTELWPESLHLRPLYSRGVWRKLFKPDDTEKCTHVGFHKA